MKQQATKKRLLMLLVATMAMVFALGLTACGGGGSSSSSASGGGDAPSGDVITLISSDSTSPGSAGNKWQLAFKDKLEAVSGGTMVVDYHGNGELGGDADTQTQLQANDIQIDVTQPATLVSFVPGFAVFDAHMVFATSSPEANDVVLNGDNPFTQGLQASAEENNMHILGWLQNGTFRQVTSNKEIRTLDDFKGFQIRTMENNNHMAFWKALGADPTPLAWAEVYISLQNGTVEGQENATDTSVGNSLQEVQKYCCLTNHVLYSNVMVVSKGCWDSLTDEQKGFLEEACKQATAEIAPTLGQLDQDSRKVMTDAGMEIIEFGDDFFNAVQDNADVQKLNESIDEQSGGLLTLLKEEIEKANK
ncbi:MAG: TRAP transporter substrate-binding protein [Coriobacteriia bacterium]|nr:TRAP transporter substrate-binding protein [Coriobacteriia bacterium]